MNEAIKQFVTSGATRKAGPHERTASHVVANERSNQTLSDIIVS